VNHAVAVGAEHCQIIEPGCSNPGDVQRHDVMAVDVVAAKFAVPLLEVEFADFACDRDATFSGEVDLPRRRRKSRSRATCRRIRSRPSVAAMSSASSSAGELRALSSPWIAAAKSASAWERISPGLLRNSAMTFLSVAPPCVGLPG
jgi:hypothetical protein